ncbi:MAG: hypothetical protein JWL84_1893 [Rhodospirillales bacterium]|jgi:uncharacterized protein YjiS (DUF1127 family)|nr:hypothetical protein [Rhodospirillales bacterium]
MATLSAVFHNIGARLKAWRERERAIAELSALDDRALADIGLHRGDIPFIRLEPDADLVPVSRVSASEPANANTHGQQAA